MSDAAADTGRRDWGSLLVALGLVVVGVASIAAVAYTGATTTVSRADFAAYKAGCQDLANRTQLTESGFGLRRVRLNETDVRRCENATFDEYRTRRRQSMYSAPFSAKQWAMYLGVSGLVTATGAVVLRQELARFG